MLIWGCSLGDRGACRSGSAFVSLQEDGAVLHLDSEPADLNVSLTKLTDLEGRTELKDLLFKMADSLMQQEAAGKQKLDIDIIIIRNLLISDTCCFCALIGSTSLSSPVKNLQKKNTGVWWYCLHILTWAFTQGLYYQNWMYLTFGELEIHEKYHPGCPDLVLEGWCTAQFPHSDTLCKLDH